MYNYNSEQINMESYTRGLTSRYLYNEKFLLVQNFTEMHPDSSEENFVVFVFAEQMCDALTTPQNLWVGHTSLETLILGWHVGADRHTLASSCICILYYNYSLLLPTFYYQSIAAAVDYGISLIMWWSVYITFTSTVMTCHNIWWLYPSS